MRLSFIGWDILGILTLGIGLFLLIHIDMQQKQHFIMRYLEEQKSIMVEKRTDNGKKRAEEGRERTKIFLA